MEFYDEEEEELNEFANIAIKTHILRADKVRLQERIERRRQEIRDEIAEAQNKLEEAQQALYEAEQSYKYMNSNNSTPMPEIKSVNPPHPKTISIMHAENELYSACQKLELVTDDYNSQCEKQKKEIQKLLKKAKKRKSQLESQLENVENTENQNNGDLEINQNLQVKIHQAKRDKKVIENEAMQIEKEVMKLIQDAEAIVSKRYRGKSKHIK
ncbi:hypothetical protein M9Y10_022174 [Tritrichomonas musculus]|uniref:Uncharacterized protein n=1 Tax=Tritrichomonas musculus TaxID=1915356 RepID=A0ABR2KRI5_9EUKA